MDEGQVPDRKIQIERHLSQPVRSCAEERIRGVPSKETPKVMHRYHDGNQTAIALEGPRNRPRRESDLHRVQSSNATTGFLGRTRRSSRAELDCRGKLAASH